MEEENVSVKKRSEAGVIIAELVCNRGIGTFVTGCMNGQTDTQIDRMMARMMEGQVE